MSPVRYRCSHCGNRFEDEDKEILECPSCFWSTSVKREDDDAPAEKPTTSASETQKKTPSFAIPSGLILVLVALLGLGAFVWFLGPTVIGLFKDTQEVKSFRIEPEDKAGASPQAEPEIKREVLSESDKNILSRRIEISLERTPSAAEKAVLEKRVPFKTGMIEQLPSQTWNLEGFKKMLSEQEKFYQVPLPRSYKKKLTKLFEATYVPGVEAFGAGDLLTARDLWIESLAFPVYANDIRKHRGVVLTMLRGFINDTLSKIGAINTTLFEQEIRQKERSLSQAYQELLILTSVGNWTQASAAILKLNQLLDHLENPKVVSGGTPPYPTTIRNLDQGIAATLFDIQTPPSPAVADVGPIREDVQAKRKVVESFLPSKLEAAQIRYDEALDHIRNQDWEEAKKKLRTIDAPLALAQDAREKLSVLEKQTQ